MQGPISLGRPSPKVFYDTSKVHHIPYSLQRRSTTRRDGVNEMMFANLGQNSESNIPISLKVDEVLDVVPFL